MRKAGRVGVLLIALAAMAHVAGAGPELGLEGEIGIASAFVWRGLVLSDEPSLHPSASARLGGLSLNVWGHWGITDAAGDDDKRIDTTLDYTYETGRQSVSIGATGYTYYGNENHARSLKDTAEVFAGYGLDLPLLPLLTVHYDFVEHDGFYGSLALSESVRLRIRDLVLDIGVAVGAGDEDYIRSLFQLPPEPPEENDAEAEMPTIPEGPSVVDFVVSVAAPVRVGDLVEIEPGVKYMTVLDREIRDFLDASDRDVSELSCSVTLRAVF